MGDATDGQRARAASDERAETRRYLREVEARFVALRGRGFALSARDVGRVLAWRERGVPLGLVLGVIEEAMRRWRADGARRVPTLGGLERSVEAALKRRAERAIVQVDDAGPDGSAWPRLKAAIEQAGVAQTEPRVREVLRRAWASLAQDERGGADPWEVAARLDEALTAELVTLLGETERAAMEREVTAAIGESARAMSERALAERQAFEAARWTRARFRVPDLVGELLA